MWNCQNTLIGNLVIVYLRAVVLVQWVFTAFYLLLNKEQSENSGSNSTQLPSPTTLFYDDFLRQQFRFTVEI